MEVTQNHVCGNFCLLSHLIDRYCGKIFFLSKSCRHVYKKEGLVFVGYAAGLIFQIIVMVMHVFHCLMKCIRILIY